MSTYYAGLLADTGILLLGALSVYIILATGQLSLGNAGFMGIGAYATSYLTVEMGLPLTSALLIAAVFAGVIGIIIGFPALRLKGIYLAMATLGFGEMVRSFFLNFETMGGSGGFSGMKHVSVTYIWVWAAGILLLVMLLEQPQQRSAPSASALRSRRSPADCSRITMFISSQPISVSIARSNSYWPLSSVARRWHRAR